MDFRSAEEHLLLQQSLRGFLEKEFPPAALRAIWAGEAQRGGALWSALADLGVCGLLISEAQGGLGLDAVAAACVLEESGRAALAEPLGSAMVAAPLLAALGGALAEEWLPQIAAGRKTAAVGHPAFSTVEDADCADLLLLPGSSEARAALHAVPRQAAQCEALPASDPSRFTAKVTFDGAAHPPLAEGEKARRLWNTALHHGALACAAQAIGVCEQLLQMSVAYTGERRQFGKAIGSFQALKHKLADVKVKLEYARPLVQRAAYSLAQHAEHPQCGVHISMAKLLACEAAEFAARQALQCHGAIGYTWEQDLHIWMRRAWSLSQTWGSARFHLRQVREALLGDAFPIGPTTTFSQGETS